MLRIPDNLRPNRSRWFWIGILAIPLLFATVAGITTIWYLSRSLPSLDQLENIEPRLVTRVYDDKGELAHEFYIEKRIWTPIDSIPPIAQQAVMSIEDRIFESHWGMNVWAIPSAFLEASRGKRMRGASTLTQQLAKNLFLTPERSIVRKIKEAMTAVRIEQTYTKQEILEFYLNTVYLGGGAYGFQAASDHYFGKPLDSITIAQTAILAGMLQRPEGYRPDRHPEEALSRRNTVLYALRSEGYITKQQLEEAINSPIVLGTKSNEIEDLGGYYIEEIRKYLEKKYGDNSLYADGIRVYSTLDQDFQKVMEEAAEKQRLRVRAKLRERHTWMLGLPKRYKMTNKQVLDNWDSIYGLFKKEVLAKDSSRIDSLRKFPDSVRYHEPEVAAILIENKTGAIRAMVGGHDFAETKYNRAVQATRQPGSSFKPFVYATAMDNGASPCDSANDQPITIPDPDDPTKTWRPANYDNEFTGPCSYRKALYQSKNLPAIQVGMKYGLNNVVSYARKFGLKAPLSAVPSLAIGSIGATLMEMTSAYTVFPNGGTRVEPFYIDSIVNKSGEVMEKNLRVEHEVLQKTSAYLMVDMLRDVNIRGTAAAIWASGFHHPSGGKTGTTNDYTDAWYIGFTKQYTMGVWVGTDAHVPMGAGHTGADDGLPVWLNTMTYVHKDLPKQAFEVPKGIGSLQICELTGKIAGPMCTSKSYCLYGSGVKPEEICDGKHTKERKQSEGATMFDDSRPREGGDKTRTRKTF